MLCGFPHYGAALTESGHILGFLALSGEHVEVNVEGVAEAYFQRFASSSVYLLDTKFFPKCIWCFDNFR